jgi:hypothetical protein
MSGVIRHVTVRGRVQGVGYRAFVADEADACNLEGWVRNCRDGSGRCFGDDRGMPVRAVDGAGRHDTGRRRPSRCVKTAASRRAVFGASDDLKRGNEVKSQNSERDWRRIHHSPMFWVGIVMCLAAIAIYVWSDDLSWRPGAR